MYNKLMSAHVAPLFPIPTDVKPALSVKRPVRAVLFDVYGTLFISRSGDISISRKAPPVSSKINKLLSNYQIDQTEKSIRDLFYQSIEADHAKLRETGINYPEIQIDEIWMDVLKLKDRTTAKYFAVEYEMITNPVYPMPGLNDMIDQLKDKGVYLGIISNAQFFTPHLFDVFCGATPEYLGFHPKLIFYSYKHRHAKPSLYLFNKAVDQITAFDLKPEEVLYIGNDMLNDVLPAHTVGFQTALFAGDERSLRLRKDNPQCRSLKPDAVVTELEQIPEMVV